jgi:hypothetical protein
MNANALAKHYDRLEPEERFRLILAADARGDDAEQNRLCQTAPRVTLSFSHHAPWAHAFHQLATLAYVELLDEVARHHDAFERWCDAVDDQENDADGREDDVGECEEDEPADPASVAAADEGKRKGPFWERMLQLYYAQGFILKTKIAGWRLFCERLALPPFALWKLLPGFDRLQSAIDLLEDQHGPPPAFEPEGMVRWLNGIHSKGAPKATQDALLSPGRSANDLESAFRRLVEWWGG